MQKTILILLLFTSAPSFASCFRLNALAGQGGATTICLGTEVSVYQGSLVIYSFQAAIQFIPAHDVYQMGLLEGHEIHVPAANEYSGGTTRAAINATVPLTGNSGGTNSGCTAQLELDGMKYCFFPDIPVSSTSNIGLTP